jgi:hypothetical protein
MAKQAARLDSEKVLRGRLRRYIKNLRQSSKSSMKWSFELEKYKHSDGQVVNRVRQVVARSRAVDYKNIAAQLEQLLV